MNNKHVLYISNQAASLFSIKGKKLMDKKTYKHDEEGLAAFSQDIKTRPTVKTQILADLTDEEFHVEQLPHVFGNDRRIMVNRRTNMLLRKTRFKYSEKQEHNKGDRQNDCFLISGITNEAMLDPWINHLLQEHIPITGIHSVPLLSTKIHQLLKPRNQHVLIVNFSKISGMRQTFLTDKNVKASRLIPAKNLDTENYLQQAVIETNKFWQFITNKRIVPGNQTGHAYVLGDTEFVNLANQHRTNRSPISFHFIDINKLIQKAHYSGLPDNNDTDAFLALLLSNTKNPDTYATTADKRYHYHLLTNRLLVAGTVAAWLYALPALPLKINEGLGHYNNLISIMQRQQQTYRLYQETAKMIPPSPDSGSNMQTAVNFYRQIKKFPSSPMPYLQSIGQSLQQFEDLTIHELKWGITSSPDSFPEKPKQKSESENESLPETEKTPEQIYPVLILSGAINTQHNIRWAVKQTNTIQQKILNSNRVRKVDVLNYPIELDPDKKLSSRDILDTSKAETTRKRFSFRIIWEPIL